MPVESSPCWARNISEICEDTQWISVSTTGIMEWQSDLLLTELETFLKYVQIHSEFNASRIFSLLSSKHFWNTYRYTVNLMPVGSSPCWARNISEIREDTQWISVSITGIMEWQSDLLLTELETFLKYVQIHSEFNASRIFSLLSSKHFWNTWRYTVN